MSAAAGGPAIRWGHSVLEPARAHVREPDVYLVNGQVVGFAICGAWLVADLPSRDGVDPPAGRSTPEATPRCSACLALLSDPPP